MEKSWIIRDTDQYFYRLGVRRATQGMPFANEKNPAKAYTFSLLLWGAGQSYSGLRMKSVVFQTCMLLFLIGTVLASLFGKELLSLLQEYGISRADAFLAGEALLFCALIFWTYNAVDAYHCAAKARKVPFHGVASSVLPLLSSFLIPGWGQFMNGQPRKGALLSGFAILGIFSLITIPAVLFCWPFLEPSGSRALIESIFAVSVLYAPLIPAISVFSSYDALKVSLDDLKKESLLDRFILAVNRLQVKGWARSAIPGARSIVALGLLGLLVVAIKRYHYFPAEYLFDPLAEAQVWLQQQGMTLVPDLINKLLSRAA